MRLYIGVIIVVVSLCSALPAAALTFLQGTVKDSDGNRLSNTSIYLSCYNYSAYKYPWQSTTTDSSGEYTFATSYTYGPCGSYYTGSSYTCVVSSSVYDRSDYIAYVTGESFACDCAATRRSDLTHQRKTRTLRMTLSDGVGTINDGMTVNAYLQSGGSDYPSTTTATAAGVYDLKVATGTYYVYASCTNYQRCDYSGSPNMTVKVTESDTVVTATLTFQVNDSTLAVAVSNGSSGIANAWVSAYSYNNTTSSSASGSSTYVSVSGQTDSNGAVSLKVPAGTYTVYVSPPYPSSYVSTEQQVTVGKATLLAVSAVLASKNSTIVNKVVDGNGNAVSGVYVSGWVPSGDTHDYFWGQTGSDGTYTASAVSGLTYQVSAYYSPSYTSGVANSTVCNYNQEGSQSAKAGDSTVSVTFTFPICDHTVSMKTVDASGALLSTAYGWAEVKPASQSSSDTYYSGVGASLSNGAGSVQVQAGTKYTASLYMWDANYVAGDDVSFTAGASKGTTDITFSLVAVDATISGNFVAANGTTISDADLTYMYVYATKGKSYRSCTASSGSYTCNVSAGDWCLGYWVDYNSGYVSQSPGTATSCYTVASKDALTKNLTLLKTGSIVVTVKNPVGTLQDNVWVEAKATSVEDYGDTSDNIYYGQGCVTNSEGTCTIHVGASADGTTYYLNAYTPYDILKENNWTQPSEQAVTVAEGGSAAVELSFGEPDGTVVIALEEGTAAISAPIKSVHKAAGDETSVVASATVDIFSNSGAYATGTTDDTGQVTLNCTVADTWYAAAYRIVSNALYMSEVTEITCTATPGDAQTISIRQAATLPECVSKTVDAGDTATFECTDGFSIAFPANSLGADGTNVSVSVAPTVTPSMAAYRPASFYGYSVTATKTATQEAIIALNGNATLVIPCNASQIEKVGLETADLEPCYFDTSNGSYKTIGEATTDDTECLVTMSVDHLTDFVIAGNGNLKGLDGTTDGVEPESQGGSDDGTGSGASSATGGCGCRTTRGPLDARALLGGLLPFLPLLLLVVLRRRRRESMQ